MTRGAKMSKSKSAGWQRRSYAAVKDVKITSKEGSAGDTEQKPMRISATIMDAQIEPYKEECAGRMGHIENVALKGAQIMPEKEECAGGMELRRSYGNYAAVKGAQIMPKKEEFV
jgi:predicted lipoprotein